MRKFKDQTQNIAEYLMAALFFYGGILAAAAEPVNEGGFLVHIFGGEGALIAYAVWFVGLGAWLIYAKLAKKKKQHKFALFGMFLAAVYTIALVLALGGGFDAIWDNIIAAAATGALWLRWKFKTEYLDRRHFSEAVDGLRSDTPPSRQYKTP